MADALTNYISALNFPEVENKKYKDFWPADIQFERHLRFHGILASFFVGCKLLIKRVFGHGWILSDDKNVKIIRLILDPIEIIKKYGIDQLRYYLVKEVSLGNDGNISMINLKACINNDLANNYGNLCQRVFSFIKKNCNNRIPFSSKLNDSDKRFLDNLKNFLPKLISLMDNQNLNEYIKSVVNFSFEANKYFNDSEPWTVKKNDPERMNAILFTIVLQIKNISILLNPIIPNATNKVLSMINISKEDIKIDKIKDNNILNNKKEMGNLEILFTKIEDDN